MAGGKETPRQKMIGLMYLVLMALLAMNVSKEVINAFVTLSNNIEDQNKDLASSNGNQVNLIYGKLNSPEISAEEKKQIKVLHEKALAIHDLARVTANFFMENANEMLNEGQEGDWLYDAGDGFLAVKDLVVNEYDKKDDYDIPTRLFVGDDHGHINEKGQSLITTLESYRDQLCIQLAQKEKDDKSGSYSFVPPVVTKATQEDTSYLSVLEEALVTVKEEDKQAIREIYRLLTMPEMVENHGEKYPWQAGQFDHAPIVAAAAMFTSLKGRVLQAEKIVLSNLNEQNDAPPFPVNKIEPLAFSSSSYINVGDSLNMSVMVAAFDSTFNTEIRYWIDDTLRTPTGMTTSNLNELRLGGGVGEHIVVGDIAVKTKSGIQWRPFEYKYSVGSPNATVSASELNVLYANGWQNQIEVAAGGYDPSTISVSGVNCTITKQGDKYVAVAKQVGSTASIKVTAQDAKGNSVLLTTKEFRIRSLPKPEPFYAGQSYDKPNISKSILKTVNVIGCGTDDGILDVDYKVESFSMLVKSTNGSVAVLHSNSNQMTAEMITAKNSLQKGQSFNITNIKASINGTGKTPIGNLTFVVE